jgi:D-proline reductase (dithiol) PrdB
MQSGSTKPHRLIHPRTDLDILENPMEWLRAYQLEFLGHYKDTGQLDWDRYIYPTNKMVPGSPGIDISASRLLVITSAGAYLKSSQASFDKNIEKEDYSIRLVPTSADFDEIEFAYTGFNQEYLENDPQVALPLLHLRRLAKQGIIGTLLPLLVSHCDCQPNAIRVVKEMVPLVLKTAEELGAQAALLLPTGRLCIQTAGLLARALEVNGVVSVVVSNCREVISRVAPPRTLITHFAPGCVVGTPNDEKGQRYVINSALSLLAQNAPLPPVQLNGSFSGK